MILKCRGRIMNFIWYPWRTAFPLKKTKKLWKWLKCVPIKRLFWRNNLQSGYILFAQCLVNNLNITYYTVTHFVLIIGGKAKLNYDSSTHLEFNHNLLSFFFPDLFHLSCLDNMVLRQVTGFLILSHHRIFHNILYRRESIKTC